MKKITIIILFAGWISGIIQAQSSNVGGYDTTRLYNAFIKALRGDTVTLAYIGGSITAGYAASTEANRWVNRVTEWWKAKFPAAHFQMVNAGLGYRVGHWDVSFAARCTSL